MADRFETLRFALAQADKYNRPTMQVERVDLGALVMEYDRLVEAIKVAGFGSVAELRRHGAAAQPSGERL